MLGDDSLVMTVRVAADQKDVWDNYAKEHDIEVSSLIRQLMDEKTGYRSPRKTQS